MVCGLYRPCRSDIPRLSRLRLPLIWNCLASASRALVRGVAPRQKAFELIMFRH
jgi:hypothetical protein